MRKPVSICCLLLAWLCANGALLDVVQVVAWSRMFATNQETMSVSDALRATFDPENACELCVGVAQAKDVATNLPLPVAPNSEGLSSVKLVLACDAPAPIVFSAPSDPWPAVHASAGPERHETVPVPPPRV